ncbi:MAG: N-acetylmuramoyl-L-alanine amidase-like domain-containing protein [Ignavibacteria bacterium]
MVRLDLSRCLSGIFILAANYSFAQIYSEKDFEICSSKFRLAVEKNLAEKPIGDIISDIGESFIGTDYEASALEKSGDEKLVINFSGLDCTTFLETVLALARCIKSGETSFEDYQNELINIRYRNGSIDKYPSRLHYFSDWIFDNQKKEIVKDITKDLGGEAVKFELNFMSAHPQSYKQLKENPEFIPVIKKQEAEISEREYFYIPKDKVHQIEDKIDNGDLIAFVTNIKGLDISHTCIAYRKDDGRIYLLHAPSEGTKVQVSKNTLPEYINKIKKHTGIIVLKLEEPLKNESN